MSIYTDCDDGLIDNNARLKERIAELEQKGNCLKWHQGMAKLEKENTLLLAENKRLADIILNK